MPYYIEVVLFLVPEDINSRDGTGIFCKWVRNFFRAGGLGGEIFLENELLNRTFFQHFR